MAEIITKTPVTKDTMMDPATPISAIKFWELEKLTKTYENFRLIGFLQAGECAELYLYTCDYGSFYFFGEQAGTQPKQSEMRNCEYTEAMEVLMDWYDKENTHWTQVQAEAS